MYQVVEHAGSDRERVVAEFSQHRKALLYKLYSYLDEAVEELCVDILKDGSTEY